MSPDTVHAAPSHPATADLSPTAPAVVHTPLGAVEYAAFGQGPACVCLHGAMGGCDQSLLLARTIGPEGYRYLGFSRPGYLGTPLASGRSPEAQADLVAAALDALGVADTLVMAVSGGGYAAIHFALRHAARCRALVLVSTTGARVEGRLPLRFQLLRLLGRMPWALGALQRRSAGDFDRAAAASIPDAGLRARTLADPEAGPLFRALTASTSDRMALRLPGTFNDVAVTRRRDYPLEQVRVPTLVVHGTCDRMVPFERHGRALAARIPGAELVAVEGGDHVSIYTHRQAVLPRVAAFLAAHAGGAGPAGPRDHRAS